MTRTSKFWISSALLLLLGQAPAYAEDFQSHYDAAVQRYEQKDYVAALRSFEAAYKLRQLPRLLINMGRAAQRSGDLRLAIRYYEAYLVADPSAEPKTRQDVERSLAQAKALLQVSGAAQEAPPPAEPKPTPKEAAPPPPAEPEPTPKEDPTPPPPEPIVRRLPEVAPSPSPPPRSLRPAGIGLLVAGGLAGAASAALFALDGRFGRDCRDENDLRTCPTTFQSQDGGIALAVVGGAALVTGTALLVVQRRRSERGGTALRLRYAGVGLAGR